MELDKERDPEEDFKLIYAKFSKTLEEIKSKVEQWGALGEDKEAKEKHFEDLFAQYRDLRDYVTNYSYSIPSYQLQ